MESVEAILERFQEIQFKGGTEEDGQNQRHLVLSSQKLDSVPQCVLSLSFVKELYLDYNDLTGLPEEFGKCLCTLETLSLIGNQLTSLPASFTSLDHLQELFLNENDLDALPESISQLKSLKTLNLVGNQISDLCEDFGELTMLENLQANENCLTSLPQSFGSLSHLTTADLSDNKLETLPSNFGSLKNLKTLNLSSNKLEDLPSSFCKLCNIRILDVSNNKLKCLTITFKSSQLIQKLYAEDNVIEYLPTWIGQMPEIQELSFRNNKLFKKPLQETFGTVSKKVKYLDLSGNFISFLPDSLTELEHLEYLHMGSVIDELERRAFQNGNWLHCLPKCFGQLANIKELHLDENQITMLPDDFGQLSNLEFLDLGQNRLHELPSSFGNLTSLRVCLLSKNYLELLPSNFGDLSSLEDMRLDNNHLAELPESFCKLTQLKSLDLFNNMLHELPTAVQYLTNLVRLDIDKNKFGIPLSKIPSMIKQVKYPKRDPSKADNWRGRGRQDLQSIEIEKFGSGEETSEESEEEEEEKTYSEAALEYAMRRNMSLWRSHDGATTREVYQRPEAVNGFTQYPRHAEWNDAKIDGEHKSSEEQMEDTSESDHWFDGLSDASSATSSLPPCVPVMGSPPTEDWDEEIENDLPYGPTVVKPLNNLIPTQGNPEENEYIPSQDHVQPYVKYCFQVTAEEGQFDDVD